jgi:OOP family OmpA-OmpF porin
MQEERPVAFGLRPIRPRIRAASSFNGPPRKHILTKQPTHSLIALATIATLGCLGSTAALAQDTSSYYYGGVTLGQSRAKLDEERITAYQIGAGLTGTVTSRDERDTGYRLFVGRQFNRYIAVEAGFFNLGKFNFSSSTVPAGRLDGQMRFQGGNVDLVGGLPITENLTAIARVGVQYAKTRDRFTGSGAVHVIDPTPSKRDTDVKLGLGLEYAFSPSFSVRTEAERYRMNDASGGRGHVNMVSVSMLFPFGRAPTARRMSSTSSYSPPMAAAPAPAPVVMAAPAPAPVVAMAAPPAPAPMVQTRRVSFSAESLFGFDKSEMRPEGRAALDTFSKDVAGSQFDRITVEGHTDRLGTEQYNQKLSTERAEAVKGYLVNQGRLDSSKITAVGKSESMPVTKPGDCKGNRATPALIACLQPDRRVDVEVNAVKSETAMK